MPRKLSEIIREEEERELMEEIKNNVNYEEDPKENNKADEIKQKIEALKEKLQPWQAAKITATDNLELVLQKMPDNSLAVVLRTRNIKNRIILTKKAYIDELIEIAERIAKNENGIRDKLMVIKDYLKETTSRTNAVEEL